MNKTISMKKIPLIITLAASLLFCPNIFSHPRYRNILVRDFRTVRNGEVISYNIGTAAHCPGTLSSLRKELPENVKLTVWADTTLSEELSEMMRMRFPDIPIVFGSLDRPSKELRSAVDSSDLLLVSSGSGIAASVRRSLEQYATITGKPTAAYGIGWWKNLEMYTKQMSFCWIRDEKALKKAIIADALPEISGYAPDAVFDFDVSDEAGAEKFLSENGLEPGQFVCCIPGFRYTPTWEFYGSGYSARRDSVNKAHKGPDNSILRDAICEVVKNRGKKVLICAEQIPELTLCREEIYDKLPAGVRKSCVVMDHLWSPQLALGVYRRSGCVFGIEMHSQVMAVGNGVPACIFYHSGFGTKADMWNTIGLGDWALDIDSENASAKACAIVSGILSDKASAEAKLNHARLFIDSSRRAAIHSSFIAE